MLLALHRMDPPGARGPFVFLGIEQGSAVHKTDTVIFILCLHPLSEGFDFDFSIDCSSILNFYYHLRIIFGEMPVQVFMLLFRYSNYKALV